MNLKETIDKMVALIPTAEESGLPVDDLREALTKLEQCLEDDNGQDRFASRVPMIMLIWLAMVPDDLNEFDDGWLTDIRQPFTEYTEATT